jgi:four helix bundle protein
MGDSLIQQKTFEFALKIVRLYRKLQARQEFVLSPQLLRSGTNIGVKVEQASAECDHRSFLDKLAAASSEARETRYWLRLLQESHLTDIDLTAELNQINEIIDLIAALTIADWHQ